MLSYEPGTSIAHRLDPRTKLAVQFAFAAAAFANTTPRGLLLLTAVVLVVLAASETRPVSALAAFRLPIVLLVAAPLLEGLTRGPPWFSAAEAAPSALAAYRVLLILLVSAAYVRTTPVRETRAAIGRLVPGRVGRFLGLGTGLVLRFLPLLRADLRRSRDAARARLVERRPLHDRMRIVAAGGLRRAFARADGLALALRARCFAWNPTLPVLRFGRLDVGVWLLVVGLLWYALGGPSADLASG